jgi:hypothetical protein
MMAASFVRSGANSDDSERYTYPACEVGDSIDPAANQTSVAITDGKYPAVDPTGLFCR